MFDLVFAIFLVIVFMGTGRFVLIKIGLKDLPRFDSLVTAFSLGFGVFGTAVFLTGLFSLNIFYLYSLLLLGSFLSLLNLSFIKDVFCGLPGFFRVFRGVEFGYTFLALFILFFLINTFVSLAPISSIDALRYHFALPNQYLIEGKIVNMEGQFFGHLPQLPVMINLFVMAIRSDISASVLNSFFALFCAFAIFCFSRRLFNEKIAVYSSVFFYCSAFVTWEATGSFVEPHLTLFCILSLYFAWLYFERNVRLFIIMSGIFLGFAFQVKIFAVGFFAIVSITLFYGFYKEKKFVYSAKNYAFWIITVLIFGSPWYVFNLFTTGNPFFPLFYDVLGGTGWNEVSNAMMLSSNDMYGVGRSPSGFFMLPFNLTFKGSLFDYGQLIGPLFLLFIPLSVFSRRNFERNIVLLVCSFVYLTVWFFASQQARFLMPVIAILVMVASSGFENVLTFGSKYMKSLSKVVILLYILFSLTVSAFFASRFVGVVTGKEDKRKFLSSSVWGYEAVEWMNEHLKLEHKVLFLGYGPPYYLSIPYIQGGPGIQGLIEYYRYEDGRGLYERLRSLGITHIYVWGDGLFLDEALWEDLEKNHLERVYYNERFVSSKRSTQLSDMKEYTSVYRLR